jgi:hypothetical protein
MTTSTTRLCQCGAPAKPGTYLDDGCFGRLRIKLRQLAPDDTEPGGTRWDTGRGTGGLGRELDAQLARQARMGSTDTRGGEKPVPFHERAAEVRATLVRALHPWATWLAGQLPSVQVTRLDTLARIARWHWNADGLIGPERVHPSDGYSRDLLDIEHQLTVERDHRVRSALDRAGVGELAEFLLDHLDTIRLTDGAAQLAAAVFDAVDQAERIIDRPSDLFALGPCGHELLDDTLCPVPLYARAADGQTMPSPDDVVVCRDRGELTGCGTEWRVYDRRAWLLGQSLDEVGTAATVATALARLGHPGLVNRRLRVWKHRGQLTDRAQPCVEHRVPEWVETGPHRGCRACGPALYRVGDVMALLDLADAAADARAARRAAALTGA